MGKKRNRNAAKDSDTLASITMQTSEQRTPPKEKAETRKEPINEIEEIFAKKKKKKREEPAPAEALRYPSGDTKSSNVAGEKDATGSTEPKQKKSKKKKGNEWPDPPPRPRRKTHDGFTIYSAEELGYNKKDAGGTPLCPFDCDCCF